MIVDIVLINIRENNCFFSNYEKRFILKFKVLKRKKIYEYCMVFYLRSLQKEKHTTLFITCIVVSFMPE